jgi:L-fuconolactonase
MPDTTKRLPLQIDAHHHLWSYNPIEFAWLNDEMANLRRDFTPVDLSIALMSSHVDASIAVQACQSLEETEWLLGLAESNSMIAGVVGWVPLEANNLTEVLDQFTHRPNLVGFREILQSQAIGFLDRVEFNRGISHLSDRGFVYDILIREHQLDEATRFVDRHPKQRFVLDHAAKPLIADQQLEPWARRIHEMARRPNVSCKISGLVTEADWNHWSLDTLRPFIDVCVEAFGPERLLAGSDWPVCLVASSHVRWWDTLRDYFEGFSSNEQERIFGGNSIEVYRLPV